MPKRILFSIFSLKVLHDSIVGLIGIYAYTYRWSCVHAESATSVVLYSMHLHWAESVDVYLWGRPLVLAFSIAQHSACNLHSADDICSHIQLTVGVWDEILHSCLTHNRVLRICRRCRLTRRLRRIYINKYRKENVLKRKIPEFNVQTSHPIILLYA